MSKCAKCGLTYGRAKYDKCPNCGSKEVIILKDAHKDCPYCGTINNFNAIICSNCGEGI